MFLLSKKCPKEFGSPEIGNVFIKFEKILSLYSFNSSARFFRNVDITVEFSDAYEEVVYGKNTANDIIEIIKTKYPNLSDKILKDIEKCLDDDSSFEGIARDIVDELGLSEDEYQETRDYLDTLQASKISKCPLLGKYIHSSQKIVLFSETIKNAYLNGATLAQMFEYVFIHELFHAFHYFASSQFGEIFYDDDLCYRSDYTSTVLKESLAIHFGEVYCDYYKIPYEKMAFSNKKKVVYYPYAGAMFVHSSNFEELFNTSINDCDKALRHLFDDSGNIDVFYAIKNLL